MSPDTSQERLLVIKLGALGDVIQALGPMAAIRRHHSRSHITLLTTKPYEDLLRRSGYADDILIDARPRWHDIRGWRDLRRRLNRGQFTRVYDLQNNDRTSFYLRLFSFRPEWVGAARGASHRNTSPERTAGRAFEGHVQTLALAKIKDVKLDDLSWMTGKYAADFGIPEPYVLLVPGSAPDRPEKRWPPEYYAQMAQNFTHRNIRSVILGTRADSTAAATIRQTCPEAFDLTEKTSLMDIACLARNAGGAIGNDTGPMHIIAATGCPSIVLFGLHSNPARHAPMGPAVICLQKDNSFDLSVLDVMKSIPGFFRISV